VFWWALRIGGWKAGVWAIRVFFSTTPAILAHSGLITTDMALAAFTPAAWSLRSNGRAGRTGDGRFCRRAFGLRGRIEIFGARVLAGAWIAMYGWRVFCDRPGAGVLIDELRARIKPACGALAMAALVIWAVYRFTFGPVEVLGGVRLPAPQFYQGNL